METCISKDGTAYVATNDFDDAAKKEVDKFLDGNIPVRVIPACIGHTRAEMIESAATFYFRKRGAKQVDIVKHYSIGDYKEKYWVL